MHSGGALKYATIRMHRYCGTVNSSMRTFRTQRFTEMERDRTERSHTTQKRAALTLQCHLETGGADPLKGGRTLETRGTRCGPVAGVSHSGLQVCWTI